MRQPMLSFVGANRMLIHIYMQVNNIEVSDCVQEVGHFIFPDR